MAHRKLAIIRRRIFTALSVLSLLLCLATIALWVRSYWRSDVVSYVVDPNRWYAAMSLRGHIGLCCGQDSPVERGFMYAASDGTNNLTLLQWSRTVATRSRSGWFLGVGIVSGPSQFWGIGVPHWFLALLFAILPAVHLRAMIRSRRTRREGLCPKCGYDLRATPDQCPECGKVIADRPAP